MMRCAITSGVSIFLTPMPSMPRRAFQARLTRVTMASSPAAEAFATAARSIEAGDLAEEASARERPESADAADRPRTSRGVRAAAARRFLDRGGGGAPR